MDVSGKKRCQLTTAHKAKEAKMPEGKGNDRNENALGIFLSSEAQRWGKYSNLMEEFGLKGLIMTGFDRLGFPPFPMHSVSIVDLVQLTRTLPHF